MVTCHANQGPIWRALRLTTLSIRLAVQGFVAFALLLTSTIVFPSRHELAHPLTRFWMRTARVLVPHLHQLLASEGHPSPAFKSGQDREFFCAISCCLGLVLRLECRPERWRDDSATSGCGCPESCLGWTDSLGVDHPIG
ncbi:uncharacterized protein BJX67DRAFT_77520 [Aspergillus lucknowensis]|uniref:Uncharacterized protein n=1 Tax=Aspergillus lucknowensis TaxID=176173 RepID=A0ABR4LTD5_9EURO